MGLRCAEQEVKRKPKTVQNFWRNQKSAGADTTTLLG
jgi:hypothetical protein